MRKTLFTAALALLVLGGCQKNSGEDNSLTLQFVSEETAPTRTAWNGEGIVWEAGDMINVMVDYGTDWTGFFGSEPLAQGGAAARFTVRRVTPGSGACRFYAVYPYSAPRDLNEAPLLKVNVPAVQTPAADSYDPTADLMLGVSAPYDAFPENVTTIPLRWSRVVAHGDITLSNLTISQGESIQNITLYSQQGADLTGDFWLDMADEISEESFAPTDENLTANSVVVLADNLSYQNNSLHFWISVMPETLTSLTVTVETDKAKYVKSFSGFEKTFQQNARNVLSISMAGAERTSTDTPAEPTYYELVTATPSAWEGHYVIVSSVVDKILTGVDNNKGTCADISISGGKIAYTDGKPYDVEVAAASNGYTLKLGSQYLGLTSDGNVLNAATEANNDGFHWTLRLEDGHVRATNVLYSNRYLQWNNSSPMFRCYTGGQKPVDFYRANGSVSGGGGGDTPVTPTVATAGASGITTSSAVLSATFTGNATYAGFEYGTSQSLGESQQAELTSAGSFSVQIDDLGDGLTYYYRAYIAVLEGSSYQYYYGDIRSFTTLSAGAVVEGDQPGWFEVPLMHTKKSGSYLVNANDANQYYAWHICAGGEKAANGNDARNFTVCFSAEDHCPLWVAAPRHSMFVGSSGRNDSYKNDPKIPADLQYGSKSTGGGCNKGHMLGSAERTCSVATNKQVFYYSNIAPQLSSGFNTGGGGWNILEEYVDGQVCADTLYEVMGCYFKKYKDAYGYTVEPKKIGFGQLDNVSMPTMFYYVLLRTKSGSTGKSVKNCTSDELKCVAFVRAHTNALKGQEVSATELMSVSNLEQITGVTYFPNVPNAPKSTFKASDWGL